MTNAQYLDAMRVHWLPPGLRPSFPQLVVRITFFPLNGWHALVKKGKKNFFVIDKCENRICTGLNLYYL